MVKKSLIASVLSVILFDTWLPAGEFFVSPGGEDRNPGTLERPFATVARARDAVRKARSADPGEWTVYLRAGTYYFPKTVVFTPEDSGRKAAPVVYTAYQDEVPIISGGDRLRLKWSRHTGGILKAEVPGAAGGKVDFDQLFAGGRRQQMARFPDYQPGRLPYGGASGQAVAPDRVRGWADPAGGFLHALHRARWGDMSYRITGKTPDGRLELEGGWQNNRPTGYHRDLLFVENVFEELDAPGEWFLDERQGVLYLYPPEDPDIAELGKARIEAAGRLRHLFEFRGSAEKPVRFLTLKGLTLTHTARTFMETKEPLLRSDWRIYRGGAVLLEGAEDCTVRDCFFDAPGGNAVFVSGYNRRVQITGCKITQAGASGVCFVGSPQAVRSPLFQYGQRLSYDELDKTPGPKTPDYPANCRVHDNLIHTTGLVEKQSAGVQISMAEGITVSHNSIYDVPRAGINVSEGTWGGHLIEGNDVFDTVRETGDHGSFNSWGRDRYWGLKDRDALQKHPEMVTLDARKTTLIRNNRWRCDHGWDIDLDDGSTNYHIYNNLCLSGGIKLREGFLRRVENNVMVNNSFHPHVWYPNSRDVFKSNIVETDFRPIRAGGANASGEQVDHNLLHQPGHTGDPRPFQPKGFAAEHSLIADARFVDPAKGDYRVKDGSPALGLGFENFPMDRFGVLTPRLRAEALTPVLPDSPQGRRAVNTGWGQGGSQKPTEKPRPSQGPVSWLGARIKGLQTDEEKSATGMHDTVGVLVLSVEDGSQAARWGLKPHDVILGLDGPVDTLADLLKRYRAADKDKDKDQDLTATVWRAQKKQTLRWRFRR